MQFGRQRRAAWQHEGIQRPQAWRFRASISRSRRLTCSSLMRSAGRFDGSGHAEIGAEIEQIVLDRL